MTLLNDNLTEGPETLTVTAQGATASILINDTSTTPVPTYSVTAASSSINEGSTAILTLSTTNVASGTSVPYTISGAGINGNDIVGGQLTGTAVVDSNGKATISIPIAADQTTEGQETLTVTAQGATASIVITDTSVSPSTFSLIADTPSVNEGLTAIFTLSTTNVTAGTSFPYTLYGSSITSGDIVGGQLTGTVIVGLTGKATISVPISADGLTEGSETLTINVQGATASAVINDTSVSPATYSLTADTGAVNEGSTAIVTLSTTNVSAGTSVSYTLSGNGITSNDIVGGQLSGVAIVGVTGKSTISIPITADQTTEGPETLTITAQGVSANVLINDTSQSVVLTPIYLLSVASSSVNEGYIATFTLTTTNVVGGTSVAFTLSGSNITGSDIVGGQLTGTAIVDSTGRATISIPIAADQATEGPETLTISAQGAIASILINDTSVAPVLTPTYSLVASSASVNEGSNAVFTLTTSNVAAGTSVAYTLFGTGITSSDIIGGLLTGNATVDSSGKASIFIPIATDQTTEGLETLIISAGGVTTSVLINDTSIAATPTYALSAGATTVNEGAIASFTLTTANVAAGTALTYLITGAGISANDIAGGQLSGTTTVDSSGRATISIPIAADQTTEGSETLTVTVQNSSATIVINDTSTTPVPTYALSAINSSVNEGSSAVFNLITGNVAAGTSVPYTLSGAGITSSDIVGGQLTATVIIDSTGRATISIPIAADLTTEGAETLAITAGGALASILINDSSTTPGSTYALTAGATSVNEAGLATFTLTTTNVAARTLLPYTLSGVGITTNDIVGGLLTGTAVVNSTGTANIFVPIGADLLTEGTEVLVLSMQGKTASITINDTSLTLNINTSPGATVADIAAAKAAADKAAADAAAANAATATAAAAGNFAAAAAAGLTFSITPTASTINEGNYVTFNVKTNGISSGIALAYTLSGTGNAAAANSSGNFTIDATGSGTITAYIPANTVSNDSGELTMRLQGVPVYATSTVSVNDTSPAYALTSGSASVSEGSIATFTLNTSNVAAGTSVTYRLSGTGITSSDVVGGLLTGTLLIDSTGKATVSIPIAADQTTEGSETLTVTVQNSSATIVINDTSTTPVPTYALSAINSSVNEGSSAVFNLITGNVAAGTSVPYTLSGAGITSGDISGGQLSGLVVVDANGRATILIPISADQATEGPETLLINVQSATASVQINDLSINPGLSISGTDKADSLAGGQGSDTIYGGAGVDTVFYSSNQNGYGIVNGVGGLVTVSSLKDGSDSLYNVERLRFADMSLALDVGANQPSGQAALLLGTVLPGKLALDSSKQALMGAVISLFDAGYSMADLAGALLRLDIWSILTGQSISASSRTLAEDTAIVKYLLSNVYGLTPDDVTLKANADVMHNEKSQGGWLAGLAGASAGQNHIGLQALAQKGLAYIAPEFVTYGVSQVGGMGNDVLEGSNIYFKLTTNLASGTVVPYALSGAGITTQDFSLRQSLSGDMTVGPYGEAYLWLYLAMDKVTEGPETLVFTSRGLSSSVVIQDTSQGPEQTIVLTPPSTSVNEGSYATFTLSSTNVTAGTVYQYTLSGTGITSGDIAGGQLTGMLSINAAGGATISIPIAGDLTTEGPETLVLTVQGKTASVVINDTSLTPAATYALAAVGLSVNEGSFATFNLTTNNVAAGTVVPYTLTGTGITSADIAGGLLSGSVSVDTAGKATISIPIAADQTTEGPETLTINSQGATASIVINDTYPSPVTYLLISSTQAVKSDTAVIITLKTTNLTPGSLVPYTLTVPQDDIFNSPLRGDFQVGADGQASINITNAKHLNDDVMIINVYDQHLPVTLLGVPKGG